MNKSQKEQTKKVKAKDIHIRATESEYLQLESSAKHHNQNLSNYMLNQSLHPESATIYTKDFMKTIFQLSDFVNNCGTNNSITKEDINSLRKEMHQLWQLLK